MTVLCFYLHNANNKRECALRERFLGKLCGRSTSTAGFCIDQSWLCVRNCFGGNKKKCAVKLYQKAVFYYNAGNNCLMALVCTFLKKKDMVNK